MKNIMKRITTFLFLGGIELFFYMKLRPQDLEIFFFFWIFIYGALLILNIFNVDTIDIGAAIGTNKDNGAQIGYLSSKAAQIVTKTKPSAGRMTGGILDPMNIIYLCLVLMNIIAYIKVMPK
ncbi:hypothetical protein HNQ80_002102 [Anaerosolibacter carboniphilus]|uniref:Uncharacterized protein n=1 Tax=Anaerosolibacter carboniphilus TaxID=1417629 RepID=A0A841KRM8_9FIRM|nr:hypothetical protein [Anaerosolibacter carboniphilus]MBB6216011.1 hypothetical protein [Anaerosolibacter carboniphilus]